jgi:hypothetical protein
MATLMGLSIDVTKIDKSKLVNGKYLNLTVSVQDETNQWGQNVSAYHEQSKEEREAKANRNYLGNGKVFWTNKIINVADKQEQPMPDDSPKTEVEDDSLPF